MSDPLISPDGKWMWNGTEWIPAPLNSPVRSANINLHDSVIGGDVNIIHNEVNPDAIGEGFKKAILDLKAVEVQEHKQMKFESEQALLNSQQNRLRFKTDKHIQEITMNADDEHEWCKFFNGISEDKYPCSDQELRTLLLNADEFWAVRIKTNYNCPRYGPITEVIQYSVKTRDIEHIVVAREDEDFVEILSDVFGEYYNTMYERAPTEAIEYLMTAISMHINGKEYGEYPTYDWLIKNNSGVTIENTASSDPSSFSDLQLMQSGWTVEQISKLRNSSSRHYQNASLVSPQPAKAVAKKAAPKKAIWKKATPKKATAKKAVEQSFEVLPIQTSQYHDNTINSCLKCGKELFQGWRKCSHCGTEQ